MALVAPALGWTLADLTILAQRWCHPWLATGRPLVGLWLVMVGPTLGWTLGYLAHGWCNPWLATGGPLGGSCSGLVGPWLHRVRSNLLHVCFNY